MTPPNRLHQDIVRELFWAFDSCVAREGGSCEVYFAPFSVGLDANEGTWVEPDLVVVCDPSKLTGRGCEGAPDLVVEVASPSNARMDYITKLALYERSGVREYWIVDPEVRVTTVYRFQGGGLRLTTYRFDETIPMGIYDGRGAAHVCQVGLWAPAPVVANR